MRKFKTMFRAAAALRQKDVKIAQLRQQIKKIESDEFMRQKDVKIAQLQQQIKKTMLNDLALISMWCFTIVTVATITYKS